MKTSTEPVISLTLEGHLTVELLADALKEAQAKVPEGKDADLFVDASAMTGYEAAARDLFVAWHRQHRQKLRRVAIVTERQLWHMIIRTMSVAAGVPMRPFTSRSEAVEWLGRT